jgi:hypothetical protein
VKKTKISISGGISKFGRFLQILAVFGQNLLH